MSELTQQNLSFYATTHYTNRACLSEEEFKHDLNRINLISRLLNKYMKNKSAFPIRLFLNHIITFYNVFEIKAATNMLEVSFKESQAKMAVLKTCLIYLNYINDGTQLLECYTDPYVAKLLKEEL